MVVISVKDLVVLVSPPMQIIDIFWSAPHAITAPKISRAMCMEKLDKVAVKKITGVINWLRNEGLEWSEPPHKRVKTDDNDDNNDNDDHSSEEVPL